MKNFSICLICVLSFLFCWQEYIFATQADYHTRKFSDEELQKINQEIDWNEIPLTTNKREFFEYLTENFKERKLLIPFLFSSDFKINEQTGVQPGDAGLPVLAREWNFQVVSKGDDLVKAVYQIRYMPGVNIADAYLNNDTSALTNDELKVYNIVLPLVKKAKQYKSDIEKEFFIHNILLMNASFQSVDFKKGIAPIRKISALGVFLDKIGNCQSFSDAFYMLGTMCGLDVGIMIGYSHGEKHMWNTIIIDDCLYFVDATYNASSFKHNGSTYTKYFIYFNAPREIAKATHNWYKAYEIEQLEDEIDDNYYYTTDKHIDNNRKLFGFTEDSAEEVIESVADGVVEKRWIVWRAMAPYNEHYSKTNNVLNYLGKALTKRNWHGKYGVDIKINKKWKYMFYTFVIGG